MKTIGEVESSIKTDHEYNTRVRQIIVEALKGRPNAEVGDYLFDATNFEIKDGLLSQYAANGDALTRLRNQKKKDAEDGRKNRAMSGIRSDVAVYKEKKLQQGKNGVKVAGLNDIVNARLKELLKDPAYTRADLMSDAKKAVEEGLGIEVDESNPASGLGMGEPGPITSIPAAWVAENQQEKKETKENGRATLRDKGGQLNNTRRQMVHGVMRVPLDKIRANFDRLVLGELTDGEIEASYMMDDDEFQKMVTPSPAVVTTEIQSVIEKVLKKHRADVNNAVGRGAMKDEIEERFKDVLKDVTIDENNKLTAQEVSGWRDAIEGNLKSNKPAKEAMASLSKEVAGLWMIGSRKERVQELLDDVYSDLPGSTPLEKDEKAVEIIKAALPRVTFGKFSIVGGKVVDWVVIGS